MPDPAAESKIFWDSIASLYQEHTIISTTDFHYGPLLPSDRDLHLLPPNLDGLRCLEAGSGAGQNSLFLASRGAQCTALDISPSQLDFGKKLAEKLRLEVEWLCSDLDEMPAFSAAPFDLIHSTYALPFSQDPEKVINEWYSLLKPGGHLLLTVGHPCYSGEWVELDEEEEGLLLSSYFHPEQDLRIADDNQAPVASRYYPISTLFRWLRDAGFRVEQFLEPEPVKVENLSAEEIAERVPYYSEDWLALYPILKEVPTVAVFLARRPAG